MHNRRAPFSEFRTDGWPLCPSCGDDELASDLMMAYVGVGPRPTLEECLAETFVCYHCNWRSRGLFRVDVPRRRD